MFGAAVRADGRPSGALAGRIALARRLALDDVGAVVFCSGAVGVHGPSEASVIADGLRDVIAAGRLVRDEESRDTLQSALAAAAYAKANGIERCIACTDNWHQPRARMLLRMFGVRTRGAWMEHRTLPSRVRARNYAREALALPYDVVAGAWALMGTRVTRAVR